MEQEPAPEGVDSEEQDVGLFDRSRREKRGVREGLWVKCPGCKEILYHKEVASNLDVCPRCAHHFRISAETRLAQLFDSGKYKRLFGRITSTDPLDFVDTKPYKVRLEAYRKRVGKHDALLVGRGALDGRNVVIGAMEYGFMGGSMGSVVGEKLTLAAELCLSKKLPLIAIACSGGARMQESILSLMQMAKISASLARLREAGLPYISVLTDPTTGGVTASFAMLGDVNLAEPGALIGFAGPRVIEQTIRQTLPEGFQRPPFLLEHGMIDRIVPRGELKSTISQLLSYFAA